MSGLKCGYNYDNRYLQRFFKMKSASLLISENVFPNIKEITESMSAFVAIFNFIIKDGINRNSENVDVYCIGDGHTPRTSALIACMTKFNCVSIDPLMNCKSYQIKRLKTIKSKIENIKFCGNKEKTAIIVCVHSHAKLSDCLNNIYGYKQKHLINIPCCVASDLDFQPTYSYKDEGIQSEKQNVCIYINCN